MQIYSFTCNSANASTSLTFHSTVKTCLFKLCNSSKLLNFRVFQRVEFDSRLLWRGCSLDSVISTLTRRPNSSWWLLACQYIHIYHEKMFWKIPFIFRRNVNDYFEIRFKVLSCIFPDKEENLKSGNKKRKISKRTRSSITFRSSVSFHVLRAIFLLELEFSS